MRKCTHCASERTPQWRKGPMGPSTLCNACGVRYKSGRLAPEYRPAASPTFTPTQHSNSHKTVLVLQKQNKKSSSSSFLSEGVRKCTQCASERTLQWRIGPMGPKTLCSACGVRYNSGCLVPEYRPAASPTFTPTQHSNSHQKVLELQQQNERSSSSSFLSEGVRKCTHCASERTLQWRIGPMGPKTLCNACGVWYNSGRLTPEYRPAASPTFTPTQHSNSHQKVLELQQQNEREEVNCHDYFHDHNQQQQQQHDFKMATFTRSSRKLKDDDNSSPKSKHLSDKGSTTLGSMATDTSGLRRSARETPSKKQSVSSPSSKRKSERIEKRMPPTPPIQRKPERVLKQRTPSPLKSSDRLENHLSSSSSGSKKPGKSLSPSSSPLITEKKKEKIEKNEKQPMENGIDERENEEKGRRPIRIVFKKNRMDARSYKQLLLKAKERKAQKSDEKLKSHDLLSQGETDNTEAIGSKEVANEAECSGRKGGELRGEESGEGCEGSGEGSSSGSEKFNTDRPSNHEETEPWHSDRIRKDSPEEGHGCDNKVAPPLSTYSNNFLQSSPRLVAEEGVGNAAGAKLGCSGSETLQKPVVMDSISEGRSVSCDHDLGKAHSVGSSKRNRKVEDLDFDASATPTSKEIPVSNDAVCSSPAEKNTAKQCVACSKRRRLDYNSLENTCFCNCEKFIDLCGTAPPEEVHKQAAVLVRPQNDQSPMHCILNDGNKDDRDHSDGKQLEVGHLTVVQRETVQDKDELCITVEISNCSDEDGREMRSRDSDIPIEEHSNMELRGPTDTQTESDHNAHVISKPGGKILYCDGNGCKKRYHMDYLDPPLEAFPLGNWHCFSCVQKKVESGVHSVSGVEAIWDVREEEVFDGKGMYKEKQYFVQYRGLAHVHNRWIPEKQLLAEAPVLVTNFKKNQGLRWKSEWLKPYRLLQKRMLMSPRQRDKCFGEDYSSTLNCHYEWLVKWSGLGYEHATWELENSPVFKSPEARTLIEEYERRRQKAKRASDTSVTVKERKGSFFQLSKLPCNGPPGLENCHLSFVNKLREYQHKCQNAVVFEDQERFMKVILFMLSMEADARRPLLVITTSSSLAAWEAEFARIAPSFGVVAYGGNKDVRKIIRAVEFFEEGGCVMFEVLLSTPDVVVEDLEFLECIGWESIVVDECQRSTVSRHFEVIKRLTTDFKLLLFSGQIKDSIAEYLNLLCFVDSRSEENDVAHLSIDSSDTLSKVKEKFSRFIASERKLEPKFSEYWVPARLSSKQLEKYCGTLLLNLITLRSCSKHDPVGALREILISCRKCCDHPYLVDEHLQGFVTKDLPEIEYLDIGVEASGKLQLFDKILQEIKQRGLRVLVLFQSISGAGRNCIGDILDDFLRQRFGPDSYERVEYGLVSAKKNAALNMFNNKQRGRFAFLLETRACLPSIKLSSVDVVILFDSDWNPLNDLRCLQKITIDSQYEQLKVFRLYSSCTVEEKVLILAKKLHLDSNIQSMNPTTSHTLLMWGASYLFKKLEEFHGGSSISAMQQSFLNDVVREFSSQLPSNADNNTTSECSLISKAQQSGATYSKNIYLLGELEMQSRDEESPHVFWTNLLEGRYPRWRYSSGSSQRVRKKVHYFDESPKRPQVIENDEGVKKRRKVVSSTTDDPKSSMPLIEDNRKDANARKEGFFPAGTSGTSASNGSQNLPKSISDTKSMNHIVANGIDQPEVNIAEVDERGTLRHSQKNLLISLKPEISRLCEVLQLPEDVKHMTRTFLEYIMNNHHVSREPATILQAFLISLCWSAASLLRHKINRKESLALAKQHLKFECKEEETQSIYSKLKAMKKRFRRQGETVPSNSIDCSAPNMNEVEKDNIHARASQSVASSQQDLEEGEIRDSSQSRNCSNQQGSDKQGHAPNSKLAKELSKCEFSSSIKQVKKTYRNRMRKIYQKQMDDSEIFKDKMEKTKAGLEKNHKFDSMLIRTLYSQMSVKLDKLKVTDQEFERKIEEFNLWKETEWGKLLSAQEAQRNEEKEMKARWLEEAKCRRPVATYVMLPMSSSGFRVEEMEDFNQDRVGNENATTLSATSADIQDPNGNMLAVPGKTIPAERPYTLLDKRIEVGVPAELPPVVPSTVSYNEAEVNVSTGQPSSISNKVSEIEVQVNVSTDPLPVVSNIVTENEVVVNGCNDLQPAALECGAVNNENDTGVLEQEITTESPQQTKTRLGSLDGGNSSSLKRMPTESPLPQQHVTPAEVVQVLSPQVPVVEQPQSFVSARAQAEDVSGCEVRSSSQVELTPPQPDHDIPLDQSNDDVPVQQPTEVQTQSLADLPGCTLNSQMELPPSVDPQLDIPACTINLRTELPPSIDPQLDVPACTLDLRTELLPSIDPQLDVPACTLDLRTELPPSIDPQLDVPACTLNSRMELPPSIDPQLDIPACTLNSQVELPSSTAPQLEVPACSLINNGQSDGGQTSLQLSEGQIQQPAEVSNHSSIPPNMQLTLENQSRPTPSQLTEGTVRLPAQGHIDLFTVSRPGPQLQLHLPTDSFVSGTGNRSSNPRSVGVITESIQRPPSAPTARVASRVSQQFLVDPLQHELTRITRDSEQASKMHEDLKMRLTSQCEKEIEEIRMKYKAMLQDAEVSFIQKRKEHEVSFHKIHMNRVLAEAFRIKFSETKTGSSSPTPGGSAGFVQQLLQVSPLQNPQRTTVSPGPSVASPPVQVVSNASALFSNPVRPHLTPTISPSGHHQVGSEIRAPAPHLQPFRPTTSMSVAGSGSSSHIMSQLSPSNPTPGSMPPHLTPRTPTYTSVPFSRGHQTESTYHNSSFPALELPPDVDNRTSVISPNPMLPLQDFGQSFNTWDMSDLSMTGSARTTAVCTSTAADNVVCLSDDD